VTPVEWVMKKSDHSGRTGINKGESCVGCHEEKGGLNFDMKRLAGKELEPKGAPKTMSFPVTIQSAYDKENAYIRVSFKAPAGAFDPADKENEVKVAVMFANAEVPKGDQVGCWATCHGDARTMPGADDKKTKYTKDGAYELMQWKSAAGAKAVDGSVSDSAQDGRRHRQRAGRRRQVRRHLHGDFHPQAVGCSGRRQGRTLRRRLSTPTMPPVVSITSRWATPWASVSMPTSSPPSSKALSPRLPAQCSGNDAALSARRHPSQPHVFTGGGRIRGTWSRTDPRRSRSDQL
jgi:hypothetical protein